MADKTSAKNKFSRERVVAAANAVAAKDGVANITFRAISKESRISLGTLTYHYRDRHEIIREATEYSKERFFRRFRMALDDTHSCGEVSTALARVVEHITCQCHEELAVDYDFYLTGLDDPKLSGLCQSWSRETVSMLEDYVQPVSASVISYLLEGIFLHSAKFGSRFTLPDVQPLLIHAIGQDKPR